jgi:hypothetical protein
MCSGNRGCRSWLLDRRTEKGNLSASRRVIKAQAALKIPTVWSGLYFVPPRGNLDLATLHGQRAVLLAMLPPRNFDNFVPTPEATENSDLALRNAEMPCQ